jgi:hypothetical protein
VKAETKAMRILVVCFLMALSACTNAVPEVSQLEAPSYTPPKAQTATFADSSLAGAQSVVSPGGYKAKVLVHGGTVLTKVTSPAHSTLEVRQLSF